MRHVALPILVTTIATFMAAPATWASTCPKLYAQCQEALKKSPNTEAAKRCEHGIMLHKQGKHDASVAALTEGLAKLGVKVEKKM
ncbi:MAG: hypothetical protein ACE5IQ_06665 [Candidatus Methylomirabilales bacterium]